MAILEHTTNGNGRKTDIGTWYITYNGEKSWQNNFGTGNPIKYRALISRNPDVYGIPDSTNIAEIDMHLEMLSEAGFDFIIFDLTNNGLTDKLEYCKNNTAIVAAAKLTCQRIALWNLTHDWKIKYAAAVGTYCFMREGNSTGYAAEVQAEVIYKEFVQNEEYGGDNYYQLDGKPLLVLYDWERDSVKIWNEYEGDRTYGEKFTLRAGQCGEAGTYGWQTNEGTLIHDEVECICPGFANAHNMRIWRENGAYFKRNWDIILQNKLPRIIMVLTFNDFNEHMAFMPAESDACDIESEEQWRDENGNLSKNMYWDMTKEGIRRVFEIHQNSADEQNAADRIKAVTRQTNNKFLNLYELKAARRNGDVKPYFVASRAREAEGLKAVSHNDRCDGVILYGVYGEKKDKVVLVRQYRYPIGGYIYEFPAGLVEPGEEMVSAGVREFYEETGLVMKPKTAANAYQKPFFTTVGMTDECCGTVYGYCDGVPTNEHQEASEDIQIVIADREECKRILREENVAIMCAYMLMHFIHCEGDPLAFLDEM